MQGASFTGVLPFTTGIAQHGTTDSWKHRCQVLDVPAPKPSLQYAAKRAIRASVASQSAQGVQELL